MALIATRNGSGIERRKEALPRNGLNAKKRSKQLTAMQEALSAYSTHALTRKAQKTLTLKVSVLKNAPKVR